MSLSFTVSETFNIE